MPHLAAQLDDLLPAALEGRIVRTVGMTAAAAGFPAPVGALVEIQRHGAGPLEAEVIGFRDELTLLFPYAEMAGIRQGDRVRLKRTKNWLRVGEQLLGRVIDARGQVIDGKPQPMLSERAPLDRRPPNPIDRPRISAALSTGVRVIDGLLTCGQGQRMGIFAGSGVGKSVLLGMMAKYTSADVNVIALIGERGREVNEFLERDLGPEGLARSVVVTATSDEPALLRVRAAFAATAVAEWFRDRGKNVLLVMDSLTRFALAQREIGLAAGEPPTTRGFPPSVFAMLPKLVERAGRTHEGSITAFYSVLVDGDDENEPIADCVRGLIDGHTWLSRKIASRNHYPAVDVLPSLSRLMSEVASPEHREAAGIVRELLSTYRENEDLISIGAYRRGTNPTIDLAIDVQDILNQFLRQRVEEASSVDEARQLLGQIKTICRAKLAGAKQ
ncbi:MAG: EscN/YscN/HrcN family type III secretion system ATPase [Pirellula sp.]|nr:EscN/YscN/HrcN family type III secretion system ATPase [Pirellula sp.]